MPAHSQNHHSQGQIVLGLSLRLTISFLLCLHPSKTRVCLNKL